MTQWTYPDEPPDNRLLPNDLFGRIACVLLGAAFAVPSAASLIFLIQRGRGFDGIVAYEVSILFAAFGSCLLIWGLLRPEWFRRLVNRVVTHLLLSLLAILLIPIAHLLIELMTG